MSLKSDIIKELSRAELTEKQLAKKLRTDSKKLSKNLKILESGGKIGFRKGVYSLKQNVDGIEGVLVKLGGNFGFVSPTDGSRDIFIPGSKMKGAMPADIVIVSLFDKPRVQGSREGEIVAIKERADRVVGTVEKFNGRLYLVPEKASDTPLHILKSADGGAKPGEVVAGEIFERGLSHAEHSVGIVARFGYADSARQCAKAILYAAGIEKSFPEAVKKEAKEVSAQKISENDYKERKDLRNDMIFTIDSSQTKDIDDAISVNRLKNGGYKLAVHIADVSYYVAANTRLDSEAMKRGNSIYYADSVIPMLPRSLSNGICSLNQGEDRLAFSCIMELDDEAGLINYNFVKSVINSKVKGVYSEINTIFSNNEGAEISEKYSQVRQSLEIMEEIYEKLHQNRAQRGAINIEDDEAYMQIDSDGKCIALEKRSRGKAEKLIEEFMMLANTSAAMFAKEKGLPGIYRVHEKPPIDKAENLKNQLEALGISFTFSGDVPTQAEYANLLNQTRGTNLQYAVHTAVLRSMSKAKYETVHKGHFGLALKDYSHFTSPIRRYSDLALHRVLSAAVSGAKSEEVNRRYSEFAQSAANAATERELSSVRIERDCDDCYKAEFMKQFLGEEFEGVVSSVMPFGIYVSLPNTAEGLIHSSRLSNRGVEVVGTVSMQETNGSKKWTIGDSIKVKLINVNIAHGNIDFELA